MKIIDCSQCLEPHWLWDSHPFESQSYHRGDEFLEFGFKIRGGGSSFTSAPGWHLQQGSRLESFPPDCFAGVAAVADLTDFTVVNGAAFAGLLTGLPARNILILRTGHSERVHNRKPEYWTNAPELSAECAGLVQEAGFRHVILDLSCDDVPALRFGAEGYSNPNGAFRDAAHSLGLLVTENCTNLGDIPAPEAFVFALPIAIQNSATAPCRPVCLETWPSDSPRLTDLSVPIFNHWRWRFDVSQGKSIADGDGAEEIHVLITGHGFTHCDAPCHMRKGASTIQELPNEGLDLFIGEAFTVDLSDLPLPTPITRSILQNRIGRDFKPGTRLILRSDLTNRVGYESREWHLKAPNLEVEAAEFIVSLKPAAICLDFPQDFIAREMPERHVYNHEFVAHHAVFAAGIPFVEDLKDIGLIGSQRPFLAAVPLKTSCPDGAPMRVLAVEW